MSLQKFQKFEVLTGSSIRVQPAVGQASFGEPSVWAYFRQCYLHFIRRAHLKVRPHAQSRLDLLRLDLRQDGLDDSLDDSHWLD